MTLRLRLLLVVLAGLAAALAVFGVISYDLYSNSLYQRLDSQLRDAVPVVEHVVGSEAIGQLGGAPIGGLGAAGGIATDVQIPPGTFGEIVGPDGQVIGEPVGFDVTRSSPTPNIPTNLLSSASSGTTVDIGATHGSQRFRVLVSDFGRNGAQVVVAMPLSSVTGPLGSLVLVDVGVGLGVLLLVGLATALVVRHGLRPLTAMAETAGAITAGDLSVRVGPTARGGTGEPVGTWAEPGGASHSGIAFVGRWLPGHAAGGASRDEVARLGAALDTMLDRIEIAFAERDATEARLRQFLADASHELRTPLTSIRGYAELFHHGAERRPEDLAIVMRRIEEEAQRMGLLVEDLLLLAKLDTTTAHTVAPVDLSVLAADACSDARAIDPDRPITLEAPSPAVFVGDEAHIRQAIGNLVSNALRHAGTGTPVHVAVGTFEDHLELEVADEGPGLDEDGLAHAFDRFWQASAGRAGSGTVLGLAIVAAIAHEHHGEVTVSNRDSGGARFVLSFPRSTQLLGSDGSSGPGDQDEGDHGSVEAALGSGDQDEGDHGSEVADDDERAGAPAETARAQGQGQRHGGQPHIPPTQ